MWILSRYGFFSIVEKPEDRARGTLTVRARVREDLDELREHMMASLGPTTETTGTDYRFRAIAPRADVANALAQLAADIDYSNFKDEVERRQGTQRADVYAQVWSCLLPLQRRS
jgi:hypothetical protein